MIEIKSPFTNWHETTKEKALEYCKSLARNITTKEGKTLLDYINLKKVRGVTFTANELGIDVNVKNARS